MISSWLSKIFYVQIWVYFSDMIFDIYRSANLISDTAIITSLWVSRKIDINLAEIRVKKSLSYDREHRKAKKGKTTLRKNTKTDCYLNDTTLHVLFGYREQGEPWKNQVSESYRNNCCVWVKSCVVSKRHRAKFCSKVCNQIIRWSFLNGKISPHTSVFNNHIQKDY